MATTTRSKRTGKSARESASEKYTKAIEAARRILTTLEATRDGLDETTHWGHDGDAGGTLHDLTLISDRIHHEGEYAEGEA